MVETEDFKSMRSSVTSDNRRELFVLHVGNVNSRSIAASCIVLFNDKRGLARIKEVCVGVAGKKYCKKMILAVLAELERTEPGIKQSLIYCETPNEAACKCYHSIFLAPDKAGRTHIVERSTPPISIKEFWYSFQPLHISSKKLPSRSPKTSKRVKQKTQ